MNRIPYINTLRVLATFILIAVHTASMFISSQSLALGDPQFVAYEWTHYAASAVNIFLMISGILLLNPNKKLDYDRILSHYIPRAILAILIFGLPMCLMEQYMQSSAVGLLSIGLRAMGNLLTGNCWTHMWYMYMLIGLYLLTPLYRAFIAHTGQREQGILVLTLLLFGLVLPSLQAFFGVPIASYLQISPILAVYPLGYYLQNYTESNRRTVSLAVLYICFYIGLCYYKVITGSMVFGAQCFSTVLFACSLLILVRRFPVCQGLCDKLAKHCFCIYLIHALYLNIAFKVVHVEQLLHLHPAANMLIVIAVIFLLSLLTSYLLRLVPFLRNRVL